MRLQGEEPRLEEPVEQGWSPVVPGPEFRIPGTESEPDVRCAAGIRTTPNPDHARGSTS